VRDSKPNATRSANEQLLRRLPETIKSNLNISYDKYVERMHEDPESAVVEYTQKLQAVKTAARQDQKRKVNLFPKSNTDFDWIKIKN